MASLLKHWIRLEKSKNTYDYMKLNMKIFDIFSPKGDIK